MRAGLVYTGIIAECSLLYKQTEYKILELHEGDIAPEIL
jgi:hypothetical protein